jgi:hypothetical protein
VQAALNSGEVYFLGTRPGFFRMPLHTEPVKARNGEANP